MLRGGWACRGGRGRQGLWVCWGQRAWSGAWLEREGAGRGPYMSSGSCAGGAAAGASGGSAEGSAAGTAAPVPDPVSAPAPCTPVPHVFAPSQEGQSSPAPIPHHHRRNSTSCSLCFFAFFSSFSRILTECTKVGERGGGENLIIKEIGLDHLSLS